MRLTGQFEMRFAGQKNANTQAHERLDRMDLMKLVELLLPKGQKDCSRIFELKKQRDNIAHGDQWDASKVIWSTVAPEFNGFVSRFETN